MDSEGAEIVEKWYSEKSSEFVSIWKLYLETGKTKAQLETKLDIGKGNNGAFLSRDFVKDIFKELNVANILNRFNDLKRVNFGEITIENCLFVVWNRRNASSNISYQ